MLGTETFPPWEPSCVEETGGERRRRVRLQRWWRWWWGNCGKIEEGFPEGVTLSWVFEGREERTGQTGFKVAQVTSSVCVGVMLRGQGSSSRDSRSVSSGSRWGLWELLEAWADSILEAGRWGVGGGAPTESRIPIPTLGVADVAASTPRG